MSFIGSMISTALLEGALGAALTEGIGATAATALTGAVGQGIAGAGIGALGSAVTGGDVGEGAMMGGITGGVLGGLGGLGNALNAGESAAQNVATAASNAPNATPIANSSSGILSNNTVLGAAQNMAQYSPINLVGNSASQGITSTLNNAPTAISGVDKAFNAATSAGQFSNTLGPVGDLAQGYANMGTLGKTGVALGTGLAANMGMNALNTPDTTPTTPNQKSQFSYNGPNYSYNPATFSPYDITKNRNMFPVYQPSYAAGGLTDVDSYASDAQNVPQDMQVPNVKDVADPSGYLGNSIQAYAEGGIANLAGLSVGGKLLSGSGDGVSDDLVAHIDGKQPARLASGEFVVPARVVSELGNGSTDAGAKRLNEMVKRVNAGRAKTLKGKSYAKDTQAYKHLPA